MANRYTTLQLRLPCQLQEASEWLEEVNRVMGDDGGNANVNIIETGEGHIRLTVHMAEET